MTKKTFSAFLMATALTSASFAQELAFEGNPSNTPATKTAQSSDLLGTLAGASYYVAPATLVLGALTYFFSDKYDNHVYGNVKNTTGVNWVIYPAPKTYKTFLGISAVAAVIYGLNWYLKSNDNTAAKPSTGDANVPVTAAK